MGGAVEKTRGCEECRHVAARMARDFNIATPRGKSEDTSNEGIKVACTVPMVGPCRLGEVRGSTHPEDTIIISIRVRRMHERQQIVVTDAIDRSDANPWR